MRLQLALKLLFPPCYYPPPTIKVLQTPKVSKLGLLSLLDDTKRSMQSAHTYSHHLFSPNRSRRHMNWFFFNSVISNQITTTKISKSPQVRSPKVQPSLNYVTVDQVSYQIFPIMQIPRQEIPILQIARQETAIMQVARQRVTILQSARQQTPILQIAR